MGRQRAPTRGGPEVRRPRRSRRLHNTTRTGRVACCDLTCRRDYHGGHRVAADAWLPLVVGRTDRFPGQALQLNKAGGTTVGRKWRVPRRGGYSAMGVKFLCKRARMFLECSRTFENSGRTPRREIWRNTAIFLSSGNSTNNLVQGLKIAVSVVRFRPWAPFARH